MENRGQAAEGGEGVDGLTEAAQRHGDARMASYTPAMLAFEGLLAL